MDRANAAMPGTERSFGLSVGGVLAVIAALLLWRGRIVRAEVVGAIGAVLIVLGAAAPTLLARPCVYQNHQIIGESCVLDIRPLLVLGDSLRPL